MTKNTAKTKSRAILLLVIGIAVVSGISLIIASRAAGPFVASEAESGTLTAPATRINDTTASGGSAIKFGTGGTVTPPPPQPPTGTSTVPNLKVAYVGDTNLNTTTKSLLNLVKAENAQLLVHLGDFDYQNSPSSFEAQTTSILGASFPVLGVLGNHEVGNYAGYEAMIATRINRVPEMRCTGAPGVQTDCFFRGLHIVTAAAGEKGTGHEAFIRSKLAASNSTWNVCQWHEQMTALQPGTKGNATGFAVYEECRMGGAMTINGHEHSYGRTKTLTSMTNQTVDPSCSSPTSSCISKGRSIQIVSGLGGQAVDSQSRCTPTSYPYGCKGEWAKFHTSSQGAKVAALFITYNVDGNPNKARGQLKSVDGSIADTFDIFRQ